MTKRVMVIDDDRGIRSFLQKSLYVKGYEVAVAERGALGLQQLLVGEFDLVFLDLNMPEISGQSICTALRKHERTKNLPVVMMTAMFQTAQQMEEALKEYGANAFLLKPFTVTDLFEVVEAQIGAAPAPVVAQPEDRAAQIKDVPAPTSPSAAKKAETSVKVESDPFSGSLSETVFPQLLHQLYQQKQTGLLHIHKKSAKKVIYIKNGYPIFARSNILGECLGRKAIGRSAS